jgi:D-lactate dehydrogenase (cytochrome)
VKALQDIPCQTPVPPDFLHDESKKSGKADGLFLPKSAEELSAILRALPDGVPVTVQGARTGISGGAVPDGGVVISLTAMNRILGRSVAADGTPTLRVQPGVTLAEVRKALDGSGLFFAPDPTETSASVGGMVACNASGACSFAYGPTRNHIEALAVVLADGDTIRVRRGGQKADGLHFVLRTDSGRVITGELPALPRPAVKNAAGYWVRPDMDLVNLWIGGEGTLGIVVEAELRLTPCPAARWGMLGFFPCEAEAVEAVRALRVYGRGAAGPHCLCALEYFDADALELIRTGAPVTGLLFPPFPRERGVALYAEWAWAGDDNGEALGVTARSLGADAWVAADSVRLKMLKDFRHAAPERVNALIAERKRRWPALTKLGTDLSVPDSRLADAMRMYRDGLGRERLESVVFGHIGDNHLHVNILPRDMDDYAAGGRLYGEWARQVVAWGGSVSAEHGIGRLKVGFLRAMMGEDGIRKMAALKALFDPRGRLNPGRLWRQ